MPKHRILESDQYCRLTPGEPAYYLTGQEQAYTLACALNKHFCLDLDKMRHAPHFDAYPAHLLSADSQLLWNLDLKRLEQQESHSAGSTSWIDRWPNRLRYWKEADALAQFMDITHARNNNSEITLTKDGSNSNWRDVQEQLIALREQGEPYTNIQDLAKRLKCSPSTVHKAIRPGLSQLKSLEEDQQDEVNAKARLLQGWQARGPAGNRAPHAESLSDVVVDNTRQQKEADPSNVMPDEEVDRVMGRLIEKAAPEKRANLNALNAEERRTLATEYHAQGLDNEPSPLEPDRPDCRPQQVKHHKQV